MSLLAITQGDAQLIGVPSLDFPRIADRHYAHVVFRAVENRAAMVKNDGGYDSDIIYGSRMRYHYVVEMNFTVTTSWPRAGNVTQPSGVGDNAPIFWALPRLVGLSKSVLPPIIRNSP